MTLTDQIERYRKQRDGYEKAIKEAREKLYEAGFVARHDARRKGESDKHWHRRRHRNRTAFKNRDKAVEHLVRKKRAAERMIEDLQSKKLELKEEHHDQKSSFDRGSTRIVYFDGHPIVEDLAYWLGLIRSRGMWGGVLVSGYRTPAESTAICWRMCNAPSCSGTCAGAATNHAKTGYPGPAADVTDFFRCEDALIDVGSGYFNDLPRDLVHMSKSGH